MAIKLKTPTVTSEGTAAELYFHITEFYRNKSGKSQFPVKYFLDDTKAQEVKILEGDLKKVYTFEFTAEEIGSDKIEKLAYDKIGEALKAASLSPESDETGSWVAY